MGLGVRYSTVLDTIHRNPFGGEASNWSHHKATGFEKAHPEWMFRVMDDTRVSYLHLALIECFACGFKTFQNDDRRNVSPIVTRWDHFLFLPAFPALVPTRRTARSDVQNTTLLSCRSCDWISYSREWFILRRVEDSPILYRVMASYSEFLFEHPATRQIVVRVIKMKLSFRHYSLPPNRTGKLLG